MYQLRFPAEINSGHTDCVCAQVLAWMRKLLDETVFVVRLDEVQSFSRRIILPFAREVPTIGSVIFLPAQHVRAPAVPRGILLYAQIHFGKIHCLRNPATDVGREHVVFFELFDIEGLLQRFRREAGMRSFVEVNRCFHRPYHFNAERNSMHFPESTKVFHHGAPEPQWT